MERTYRRALFRKFSRENNFWNIDAAVTKRAKLPMQAVQILPLLQHRTSQSDCIKMNQKESPARFLKARGCGIRTGRKAGVSGTAGLRADEIALT
jgi:hypothetical protein